MKSLREIIKEKILIFDGATGTYFSTFNLKKEDFGGYEGLNDYLSISKPEIVLKAHEDYISAGSDVIETNTFGANRAVLREYGLENRVKEINFASAGLALEAKKKALKEGKNIYVAGSIGPTNKSIFVTGGIDFDEMKEIYSEQTCALIESGVDLIIFETAHDILNVKAGLAAAYEIFNRGKSIEVIASFTMDKNNLMLSGQDIKSAYAAIEHFPLLALGFNCSTGPENMAGRLSELSNFSRFATFIMPNAGLPDENGKYPQTPEKFSTILKAYGQKGFINIVGGCCGTMPEHIKEISTAFKDIKSRRVPDVEGKWFASSIDSLSFEDIEPPVLIGERNNSVGSRKFRRLMAESKFDEAVEIAKSQEKAGAQILDLCFSNPERDEKEDIRNFVPRVLRAVRIPLMLDTTDIDAMEEFLKLCPGKSILNSVNFEFGEEKPARAAGLVKTYGGKMVFGVIDENGKKGLPLEAERKKAIAARGYEFLTGKCGLRAEDILFDALVFPAAVGEQCLGAAFETIKAVREFKKLFPFSKTILGVSNVSFGLPPAVRSVVESVFLRRASEAGLDMAIVNVEKIRRFASLAETEKEMAEKLLFGKDGGAPKRIAGYFRNLAGKKPKSSGKPPRKGDVLRRAILDGMKAKAGEAAGKMAGEMNPLDIINGPVLGAMDEVGRLFGKGEMIITEVLQSAEAVKAALDALRPFFKSHMPRRGKVLLATVSGDVHDIGKNLVRMIFESNSFEVVDLGVKVPSQTIARKALSEKPDFIGLSGLISRSAAEMVEVAKELERAGIKTPLLLGGAVLTKRFVENRIAPVYGGKAVYSKTAMDGLSEASNPAVLAPEGGKKKPGRKAQMAAAGGEAEGKKASGKPAGGKFFPDNVPEPKDLERHVLENYDLEEIFANLNEKMFNARFLKLSAGGMKAVKTADLLKKAREEIISEKRIKARSVYRIFRARSSGDEILFLENGKVAERINFARLEGGLSLADFVSPEKDYAALFAVNCGDGIREFSAGEMKKGNYLRAYLAEAFAMSLAEAFAEVVHYKIRENFGIAEKYSPPLYLSARRGGRFSFGYRACPDLSNQEKLFKLLRAKDIGLFLTSSFMMEPEASVSGIVLHNDKAPLLSLT